MLHQIWWLRYLGCNFEQVTHACSTLCPSLFLRCQMSLAVRPHGPVEKLNSLWKRHFPRTQARIEGYIAPITPLLSILRQLLGGTISFEPVRFTDSKINGIIGSFIRFYRSLGCIESARGPIPITATLGTVQTTRKVIKSLCEAFQEDQIRR